MRSGLVCSPFTFLSPHDFIVNSQIPRCVWDTSMAQGCGCRCPTQALVVVGTGRSLWGEPWAAPSQTIPEPRQFQLAPTYPSQGTGSHGSTSRKTKLHSSEEGGRCEKLLCHTQVREGRREECSSSRAEIPLQPTVKMMLRQPVLWQTVETPCGSRLLAVACGEEPMRGRLSVRSLTLGRTHSVAVCSQKTGQRMEKSMKDCILWMEQHEEGAAKCYKLTTIPIPYSPVPLGVGRWKNQE